MKYAISHSTNMLDGSVRYEISPANRDEVIECLRSHGWSAHQIEDGLSDLDAGLWFPVSDTVQIS